MSRVGKKPIDITKGVKANITGNMVLIEGPKGKLEHHLPDGFTAEIKDGKIWVLRPDEMKKNLALHGLTRANIANSIKGVSEGYVKNLEIKGVGFKAQAEGNMLQITIGFSHPVKYEIPEGITIATKKPTQIAISGIDKIRVGEAAAEVRSFFKPEPYTGKGIMYVGEHVRRKAGKTVA